MPKRTGQLDEKGCRSTDDRRTTSCQTRSTNRLFDHCGLCGLRAGRTRWSKSPVCADVVLKLGKGFELFVGAPCIPNRCCGSASSLSDQHKSYGVHYAAMLPTKDPMF